MVSLNLSTELDAEILEEKHIPNPIAKELLEKVVRVLEISGYTPTMLIHKTLDYLRKYSKMSSDRANALDKELQAFNLKPETRVMIINICPETLDELRTLLVLEERIIETEEAEKILDIARKYCFE